MADRSNLINMEDNSLTSPLPKQEEPPQQDDISFDLLHINPRVRPSTASTPAPAPMATRSARAPSMLTRSGRASWLTKASVPEPGPSPLSAPPLRLVSASALRLPLAGSSGSAPPWPVAGASSSSMPPAPPPSPSLSSSASESSEAETPETVIDRDTWFQENQDDSEEDYELDLITISPPDTPAMFRTENSTATHTEKPPLDFVSFDIIVPFGCGRRHVDAPPPEGPRRPIPFNELGSATAARRPWGRKRNQTHPPNRRRRAAMMAADVAEFFRNVARNIAVFFSVPPMLRTDLPSQVERTGVPASTVWYCEKKPKPRLTQEKYRRSRRNAIHGRLSEDKETSPESTTTPLPASPKFTFDFHSNVESVSMPVQQTVDLAATKPAREEKKPAPPEPAKKRPLKRNLNKIRRHIDSPISTPVAHFAMAARPTPTLVIKKTSCAKTNIHSPAVIKTNKNIFPIDYDDKTPGKKQNENEPSTSKTPDAELSSSKASSSDKNKIKKSISNKTKTQVNTNNKSLTTLHEFSLSEFGLERSNIPELTEDLVSAALSDTQAETNSSPKDQATPPPSSPPHSLNPP